MCRKGATKSCAHGCTNASVRMLHLLSGSLLPDKTWGSDKDASGRIFPLESPPQLVGPQPEQRCGVWVLCSNHKCLNQSDLLLTHYEITMLCLESRSLGPSNTNSFPGPGGVDCSDYVWGILFRPIRLSRF